jgi:hypothetical protein
MNSCRKSQTFRGPPSPAGSSLQHCTNNRAYLTTSDNPAAQKLGNLIQIKFSAWFVRESWQFNFYTQCDGSLRLDQLPPGTYHLLVNVLIVGQPPGLVERDFEIPASPTGNSMRF